MVCFHCGEPLPFAPVQVRLDGIDHAVCCGGCAAAAMWIRDAGLAGYYRLRTADGQKAEETPPDFSAWDHEDLLAEHSRKVAANTREITVLVEGIRCAACAWLIGRALGDMQGVIEAEPNAVTGRLHLRWDPQITSLSRVLDRLARLGYHPYLATGEAAESIRTAEYRDLIKRMAIAGIGTLQAMMFAEALYLDFHQTMPEATRDFFRWLTFLVSTPVVFYAGKPFLSGMRNELRLRRFGMDTLIASSVLIAYFASLVETLRGGPHVWFDAAVMFVLFLLLARFIARAAQRKAQGAVDHLARARPALAWRERDDGGLVQVPLHALAPGDHVYVRVGEAVPADGTLLDACAELDESLLTGESRPAQRRAGEPVYAGALATNQPLRLEVGRTGQDTLLSHLLRLVERAQVNRPRMAQLADAIASRFVIALFSIAAVVAVVWSQVQPERAFDVTLAVLIVSCPCALSLAIPAALAAAHARQAGLGVLVLRPDALETLAKVDTVVLDKTGTLTCGRMRLLGVEVERRIGARGSEIDAAMALRIAAALEHGNPHPIAAAFAVSDAPQASDIQIIAGQGVEGVVEGNRWRLGKAAFVDIEGEEDDAIHLAVITGTTPHHVARFHVGDTPRTDATSTVATLRAMDLDLEILSGDAEEAVATLAHKLHIDRFRCRQRPEDKLARVRELQAQGHVVAMLGDGINDAPVLAGADVSIALAGGAPLAHRAADVVLMGESLSKLPASLMLARHTRRRIRQNLTWALGYNIVALPFAALGFVTPWMAAIGMAASSLVVTLNALRLARTSTHPTVATEQLLARSACAPSTANAETTA